MPTKEPTCHIQALLGYLYNGSVRPHRKLVDTIIDCGFELTITISLLVGHV